MKVPTGVLCGPSRAGRAQSWIEGRGIVLFDVPGEAFKLLIDNADWLFAGMDLFRQALPFCSSCTPAACTTHQT